MVSYHDNDHYNSVRDANGRKGPTPPPPPLPPPPAKIMEDKEFERAWRAQSTHSDRTEDESMTSKSSNGGSNHRKSKRKERMVEDGCVAVVEEEQQSTTLSMRPKVKKTSGPCPCGSGKSYRKCCKEKDKRAKAERRAKKSSSRENSISVTNNQEETQEVMENGFRVMKI